MQRIDEEEKRKEQVKDSLAGMLPWETRDEEREILVEECKEAILALSADDASFLGPYQMPALPKTDTDEEEEEEQEEIVPSPESLEKLSKLEPLPPLLAEFDLDAHVGLIQRLLQVDENLVEQQSKLSGAWYLMFCWYDVVSFGAHCSVSHYYSYHVSGAGDREKTFWRNYFFHCAFTRYEAGLSIDEVWNDQQPPANTPPLSGTEETITFEAVGDDQDGGDDKADKESSTPLFDSKPPATTTTTTKEESPSSPSSSVGGSNEGTDYEMISGGGSDDAELDELEAEIARELED